MRTGAPWRRRAGWLDRQAVFCLNSPYGAIDVFRRVTGLDSWSACRFARMLRTAAETPVAALCDEDMLRCQLALPEGDRKEDRIRALRRAIEGRRR